MEKRRLTFSLFFTLILFFFSTSPLHSQLSYNMTLLKNLAEHGATRYSALWGYTAPNGREYAILGCRTGAAFIDITDSSNIHEVGFVPSIDTNSSGNVWREMKTYSHYAYIVSEVDYSGIQIVDLQYLPDSIHFLGRKLLPNHRNTHTISQEGPYLYLNGTNVELGGGTTVVDLSGDPENPVIRGSWSQYYIHDCRVLRDTIYACNIGDNKISIIDARNKDNLTTITTFPTTPVPQPHNCAVTNDRKYLYSTDETTDGKLKIWNIQNIQEPILVKRYIPPGIFNSDVIHNVEIFGNYAYIAYYTAGVQVLDISDPVNPVLIGFYDTEPSPSGPGCWAVYKFASGKIIASDIARGLFVLRLKTQSEIPQADFLSDFTITSVGREVNLVDLSSGIPTSWDWTITGPQNLSFNVKNPAITFYTAGIYSVKLKVSNSLGSDSLAKTNYITVGNAQYGQFGFSMPTPFTINTSPYDTSKFLFRWSKTGPAQLFTYKLSIKKATGSNQILIPSANNGRDTTVEIRKSFLDSVGRSFGFSYDSVICGSRVYAYNGVDSAISSNVLVFTLRTNTVGINNISTIIPNEDRLYNNFPNPFNPNTKIKFDLTKSGFILLTIFDITGKEVVRLVNENLAAGSYEYNFNASNLSSGVYFYKLESAGLTEVKKMSLIK